MTPRAFLATPVLAALVTATALALPGAAAAGENNDGPCATLSMTDRSGSPATIVLDVPDGVQLDDVSLAVTVAGGTATEPYFDPNGDFTFTWTTGPDGWVGTASLGTVSNSLKAEPVSGVDAGSAGGSITVTTTLGYVCEGIPDSIEVSSTAELVPTLPAPKPNYTG